MYVCIQIKFRKRRAFNIFYYLTGLINTNIFLITAILFKNVIMYIYGALNFFFLEKRPLIS